MMADQLTVKFEGDDLGADLIDGLAENEFSEVERHAMTGAEGDLAWIVGAILGSPVVVKVLDILDRMHERQKVGKITVAKDGRIVIDQATPEAAAKIIRSLEKDRK